MRTYENKDELKNEINKSFAKYISEFNDIPEHLKDKRIDEIDRTPAENLAYQVGWTTLVIKWESDERKGIPVKTPSDNFKWNQLGELYQWFTDTYAHLSLQELKDMLGLPFIDEQPPGESIELDEELLGEEVVIWVLEKHNNDVVRDGEAMRVSGTLSEFNDYDVVLKNGRCGGSCSVAKQMDGSVIVEREKIISVKKV